MRAQEIRELSDEELKQELENSHKESLNIRFRVATKQMSNTAQVRSIKKNIARLKTVIRERELGAR